MPGFPDEPVRFHFGRVGARPDWRAETGADRAANDDDDAEPTPEQAKAVESILGFDPYDIDSDDEEDAAVDNEETQG
jgi:hypothetical protein